MLPNNEYGCSYSHGLVKLPPTHVHFETEEPMTVATFRLETLLHEVIHVYFEQFACRHCPTYDVNVANAAYHR